MVYGFGDFLAVQPINWTLRHRRILLISANFQILFPGDQGPESLFRDCTFLASGAVYLVNYRYRFQILWRLLWRDHPGINGHKSRLRYPRHDQRRSREKLPELI